MSRQVILQILRAPDSPTRLTLVPEDGELIYQKDDGSLYVGDGSTSGGNFLALIGTATPIVGGANVGVSGVGPFKQVNGTTIEFKNLNAGSAKVIITNDTPNDEIDIDIDPAQILTSTLNNDEGFEGTTALDNRDTANRARANHTGTQVSSTISDFAATVRSTVLTGISFATSTAVLATDTVLEAIGKLQAQINNLAFSKVVFSDYIEGTTANPETTIDNPGSAPVLAEMTKTFTPADANNDLEVFFSGTFGENGTGKDETVHCGIFVDGVLQTSTDRSQTVKTINDDDKIGSMSTFWHGKLSAASHTVTVRFWIQGDVGATARGIETRRAMFIRETDE